MGPPIVVVSPFDRVFLGTWSKRPSSAENLVSFLVESGASH